MLLPSLFTGIGILIVVLGIPLARRKVPPNRWYGVRVRATLADAATWYRVNATAGRWFAGCGAALVACAWTLHAILPPIPSPWYPLAMSVILLAIAVVVTVVSLGRIDRA